MSSNKSVKSHATSEVDTLLSLDSIDAIISAGRSISSEKLENCETFADEKSGPSLVANGMTHVNGPQISAVTRFEFDTMHHQSAAGL